MPKIRLFRIGFIGWLVFITWSSLFSFSGVDMAPGLDIPHADKLVHFVFYFVLVCLGVLAAKTVYRSNTELKKVLLYAVLFAFFYGIIIEVLQYAFTVNRQGDIWDVLANATGALFGMFLVKYLVSRERSLK